MGFFISFLLTTLFTILSDVLKPKPKIENARPADLGDFSAPTATEGRSVPLLFGTCKLSAPNVVWYGDKRQKAIKEKIKTGLFSSTKVTTGYKYFLGIQYAFVRGPIDSLLRMWIKEKEVFNGTLSSGTIEIDEPKLFGGQELGSGGFKGTFRFFQGTQTQAISTYLNPFQNEGGASPAYRGTAYGVFEQAYVGNAPTISLVDTELRRISIGPGGLTKAVNSGADSNPAYAIYELLTNLEWGLKYPSATVDSANFNAVADVLVAEGNGFSIIVDRVRETNELIQEIERQIDGALYFDKATGLWSLKLARDDFVLANIPVLDENNLVEITDYTRGAWEDTSNQVNITYVDRDKDYFGTSAMAQNLANADTQQKVVPVEISYPGVKNAALAASIATRELNVLSTPLAKASVEVDRSFWNARPGDVIKWTNDALGFTDLVMRITKIRTGSPKDQTIQLDLIQDIFSFAAPTFAAPPPSGWVPPASNLVAIPALQSVIFEAPYAFIIRDTDALTINLPSRVWAGARNQNDGAVQFTLRTKLNSGPVFQAERTIDQFMYIGELAGDLDEAVTDATLLMTPTPDGQSLVLDEFLDTDPTILGNDLTQIILINNEFMLVENAVASGGDIQLQNVYRGTLDSAPTNHSTGDSVFMLFVGGGIGNKSYANGDTVDVRLVPEASDDELAESSATNVQVTMNNRDLRPYPPIGMTINASGSYPSGTQSIDANGTLDAAGLLIGYVRKDKSTFQENDANINGDAAPINATTLYRGRVFDQVPTELFLSAYNAGGNTVFIRRTDILAGNNASVPDEVRIDIETKHTVDAVDYEADQDMQYQFLVDSSDLDSRTELGLLNTLIESNIWVAPETGSYNLEVGTANTGGPIQYELNNSGTWITAIASSATTGTLTATASDDIRIRANGLTLASGNTILIVDPPTLTGAFAIFEE